MRDIEELSRTEGLSKEQQVQLCRTTLQQTERELQDLLPTTSLAAYKEFRSTLPFRVLAETTAERCATSGVDFPPEKINQLMETLRTTKGFIPYRTTVLDDRNLAAGDYQAIANAAYLLTPTQLEALRASLAKLRETESTKTVQSAKHP